MSVYHTPVLLNESISALDIQSSGIYIDATLGGGGHSKEILSRLGKNGRLIVFDKDIDALKNAPKDERVIVVHNNFRFVHNFIKYYGYSKVDGIIADLGVSSHQFDSSQRGFSFRFEAGLDMRMNILANKNAVDILNNYREEDISRILKAYGEVSNSHKVAKLICSARASSPIINTSDLAAAIKGLIPQKFEHKFLAKIYQALRIEVNGEMDSLEYFLRGAQKSLKEGGRISVITYHSLEDRMVKNFIRSGTIDGQEKKDIFGNKLSPFRAITKKPFTPSEEEIHINKRARSAKLRVAEKILTS